MSWKDKYLVKKDEAAAMPSTQKAITPGGQSQEEKKNKALARLGLISKGDAPAVKTFPVQGFPVQSFTPPAAQSFTPPAPIVTEAKNLQPQVVAAPQATVEKVRPTRSDRPYLFVNCCPAQNPPPRLEELLLEYHVAKYPSIDIHDQYNSGFKTLIMKFMSDDASNQDMQVSSTCSYFGILGIYIYSRYNVVQ